MNFFFPTFFLIFSNFSQTKYMITMSAFFTALSVSLHRARPDLATLVVNDPHNLFHTPAADFQLPVGLRNILSRNSYRFYHTVWYVFCSATITIKIQGLPQSWWVIIGGFRPDIAVGRQGESKWRRGIVVCFGIHGLVSSRF